MRTATKTAFRPGLETAEARLLTSSGLIGHHAPAVSTESHHAHRPKHHQAPGPGHQGNHPTPTPTPSPVVTPHRLAPNPPLTVANNSAWIQLVNMTGQDLEYQLSLAPYQGGRFLPFNIAGQGGGSVQYRMSSLIVDGQRVEPSFQIRFGNGLATALMTGPSQKAAQGYYIFLDSNLQYYVAPFIRSTASY